MNWTQQYVVDTTGQCLWKECYAISDEGMKMAYRMDGTARAAIELSSVMGVKTGRA